MKITATWKNRAISTVLAITVVGSTAWAESNPAPPVTLNTTVQSSRAGPNVTKRNTTSIQPVSSKHYNSANRYAYQGSHRSYHPHKKAIIGGSAAGGALIGGLAGGGKGLLLGGALGAGGGYLFTKYRKHHYYHHHH